MVSTVNTVLSGEADTMQAMAEKIKMINERVAGASPSGLWVPTKSGGMRDRSEAAIEPGRNGLLKALLAYSLSCVRFVPLSSRGY